MIRALALLVVAHAVWVASAAGQPLSPNHVFGRYQQAAWQERDGLPQNSVLAIAATRDGYLWVGTYEGAARFDGVRFTRFDTSNTTGLGNAFVGALLESRNGDLWMATYGGGVSRLSGGVFTQYTARDGLATDFALCLFEDDSGTMWIGTDGGGVSRFRDGRFTTYTVADGLPSNLIRSFAQGRDGTLLVGTSGGIARIANGRAGMYEGHAAVANADIRQLVYAADGSLWVATYPGELYREDAAGVTHLELRHGVTRASVDSLFADRDGVMWVGTLTSGLFRYESGRFERYGPEDGLPGARVAVVARAADEGYWVGTNGGLVRFRLPRFTLYTARDGLPDDYVVSLLEDADGTAWVKTPRGLARFKDGGFRTMTARDGLPADGIRGMSLDRDRRLLVYTPSGLWHWTRDRFVRVDTPAGIPWGRVQAILEDRSGTFWIGIHDGGLLRLRDGRLTPLTTREGLTDDSVLRLFEDRAGSIWVGTLRHGVTRVSDDRLTSWSVDEGLAANHVKAFYQDADGTMWIGTHGGGLSRFKDGAFANISTRQGMGNDDIFEILEDDDANLWMNCNTGIWRTSLTQLREVADGRRSSVESFVYATADGMLSSEGVGSESAGWKMRDGSLWFPTIKGVVAVDPRRRDAEPPRVLVEGITIDRQPLAAGGPVRLMPGQQNLEIQYTAITWSRPQAVRFRYRLAGLDRDWVDADARRTAYYSYLPPGSYTFTVIADNGEGVWNETGQSLAVVVLPPFYQTWWFRIVAASSLIGLVWLSWRYRVAQLRRAQAAQEAFSRELIASQERERQRIAAELHDSLGQSLLVVKNRAMLGALSQPGEEALKQFTAIGSTVAQTLEEVRTISYNLRPHHLDQLGLTTTIGAMVQKIGESSGIRMTSELDDIDGAFAPVDEITIYRIVQESLNNVVKHSGASDAQVAVRSNEHHVDITIRDNGQGFAPRTSEAGAAYRGGFGLKGLAQRAEMLGGSHTIESSPGRGTTVRVRIDMQARRQGAPHGD